MERRFETDCMYCPQCGDEYRLEIRTCAACGVALVTGTEMAQATPAYREITPLDRLRTVRRGSIPHIRQLQACLRAAGLASLVAPKADGHCSSCRGPEVELRVRAAEVEQVEAVLAREYRQSTALAEHAGEAAGTLFDLQVGQAACPACGCLFSTDAILCPDCGLRFV